MAEYKYIQELLQTGIGSEGSLLIPATIYDRLIEEVEKALIPRSEAAIYMGPAQIPGSSIDLNLFVVNSMSIRSVGEGAEIPIDVPGFSHTNVKPLKYGVRIPITREMLEDGKWNLMDQSIRYAAKKMAENETNLILVALDGAANTVTGGAAITIANITRAMQYLEDSDYKPTTMLVGPEVVNDLRNIDTFVEVNKLGSREMIAEGFVGVIYGMNVIRFSATAAPSTTYSKYAYVTDKKEAFAIAEKRPITMDEYDLVTHDMSGAVVTQRIAIALVRSSAVAKITST